MDTPNGLATEGEVSIYEKLRAVQVELHAPKNQVNKFGGYNYRSAEDILEAVKPVLASHGLTLIVSDEVVQIGDRIYVAATATVFDGQASVSAVGMAREPAEKRGMDLAQLTGATSSYARKYALNGLFAIDDSKDADTDSYTSSGRAGSGPSTGKPAASTEPSVASVGALFARKQIPADVVKAKVRDLGFTGLSAVDDVNVLAELVVWAETEF